MGVKISHKQLNVSTILTYRNVYALKCQFQYLTTSSTQQSSQIKNATGPSNKRMITHHRGNYYSQCEYPPKKAPRPWEIRWYYPTQHVAPMKGHEPPKNNLVFFVCSLNWTEIYYVACLPEKAPSQAPI